MEILSNLTVGTMSPQSTYSIQGNSINGVNGVTVGGKATMQYDSTNECINFVFA